MFRSLSHLNSCSSLNRIGSEFLIRPDIGSPFAKRFSATLLTHPEVNHHTGRGCNPTVRECYFLLFLLDYESEIFISLSSSRLRSEQLSTAIEESSRTRSFKFSIMTMLKKISIMIGEKVLDYDQ